MALPTARTPSASPTHQPTKYDSHDPSETAQRVVAPISAPTTGPARMPPAANANADSREGSRRIGGTVRLANRAMTTAPTSGSSVLARTNPAMGPSVRPFHRSIVISATATAASTVGHRRRGEITSAPSETPAAGKNDTPMFAAP